MKSLLKDIAQSTLGLKLRNFMGYRPVILNLNYRKSGSTSISDAFPWRTDNGYKTKFNYSDILGLFYKIENSFVEIFFYSKNNELIKKLTLTQLDYSNEIIIDKAFLNGIEDYGVFYIFHRADSQNTDNLTISNRCYVGFSNEISWTSYVHGNGYVGYQSLDGLKNDFGMVLSSFFKKRYRIQNSFIDFNKSELFFVNPTSEKINFSVCKNQYFLEKGSSMLIDVSGKDNISIISRSLFLRPIVFNYKDNFFDVYHA